MEPIDFPENLVPSSRTYKPGAFAEERFTAQNGATTRLRYGSRLYNSTLSLTFQNISDENANSILNNYKQVMEGDNYANFKTTNAVAGAGSGLQSWMREVDTGLKWKYAGPPNVSSVRPGLSTVSCEFVGELEGA